MSKLLQINQLEIVLKKEKRTVVKSICFSLEQKGSLIILGQSGCGKTMTCHSMMGLLDAKKFSIAGEILYNGINLLTLPSNGKRKLYGGEIAFIPQNPMTALDPSVKIGKQMFETLSLHTDKPKSERKSMILTALKKAGLDNTERVYTSYPHELSGGMLQRVLIAMVLMVNARLVIADEPTTALDVVHRNETIEAFKHLRDSGTAFLMVTHDFAAAVQLGGDMMIMNDGEIIECGKVNSILTMPKHKYTRQLIEASVLSGEFKEEL
ncbi:MAG: ABC transporter ATP-binding protein [Lachnospiraceae bacterium]|nr:ABC transporter ATP-binding protein [Lachnospiraceae bacterium]